MVAIQRARARKPGTPELSGANGRSEARSRRKAATPLAGALAPPSGAAGTPVATHVHLFTKAHDAGMSSTLGATPSAPVELAGPGVTWRRVLTFAALGQLAMAGYLLAVSVVLDGRFDPTPVVIGAVVGIGVWRLRRGGRGAVAYAGVVSGLLLLMVVAFGGAGGMLRPQSTFEFVLFGGFVVSGVLGLVALPGAWADGPPSSAPRIAARVAGAAVVVVVVVGVVAGAVSGSATRMAGDLSLRAKNYEFNRTVLEAKAGRVAVFVENGDVSSHDFTIKDVVHKQLPGQKAGRAVFDVEPGTYRFYCSLHPDMEGMLRVS